MKTSSDYGGYVERRFSKNETITNVMLYWSTRSIDTSFLGHRDLLKRGDSATPESQCDGPSRGAPEGFAMFPYDILVQA